MLLCQIARRVGARVIATVGTEEKARLAREAGAQDVILYTNADFQQETMRLTGGAGVQVVYDSVGKTTFLKGLDCLVPRGMMVLYGQSSGPVEPFDPQLLNQKGSLFLTRPTIAHYLRTREELLGRANDVFGWVADGSLKVRIGREFPLGAAAEAHSRAGGAAHDGQGAAPAMIERALVSTEWLAAHLGDPHVAVVDASMYLPTSGRDAAREYEDGHIAGAVFFDLEASSDTASHLPHMLPSAEAFAGRMSALGLSDGDDIVVYDGSGANLSAARVWWMFRLFGHERVAVLDGGFGKWRREGRPVERGMPARQRGHFTARAPRRDAVLDLEQVRAVATAGTEQIVDMRSAGRFAGAEPEPRAGLRGGHIPGSLNLPFQELVGLGWHRVTGRRSPAADHRGGHRSRRAGRRDLRLGRERLCADPRAAPARPRAGSTL